MRVDSDVSDLEEKKPPTKYYVRTNNKITESVTNIKACYILDCNHATYWLRAASPFAACVCCEESPAGAPVMLLAVASLGMRLWPCSSVVFGEAGGV